MGRGRGGGSRRPPVETEEEKEEEERKRTPEGNLPKKRRMLGPLSKRQQRQSPLAGTSKEEEDRSTTTPLPQREPRGPRTRRWLGQTAIEMEQAFQGPDPPLLPGKLPLAERGGSTDDTVAMSPMSARMADSPSPRSPSPEEKRTRSEDTGGPEPGPSVGPSTPSQRKSESTPVPSRSTFAGFKPGFFSGGTKEGSRRGKASKGRGK